MCKKIDNKKTKKNIHHTIRQESITMSIFLFTFPDLFPSNTHTIIFKFCLQRHDIVCFHDHLSTAMGKFLQDHN